MAELVLSTVGQALGSRLPGVWGQIGAALGRAGGAALGKSIDQQLFGPAYRREGPRLTDLHVQSSTEGASLPAVYGRVRIAGQVIWAARFKEHVDKQRSGGKGGGPRVTTQTYRYSLSFAVGLCEGPIARIARVWANGEPLDMSGIAWRLHKGDEDQAPDPLIESIEGADMAPAYRGLAYVVFEDLPLEAFGNLMPHLSFEIVRPSPGDGPRFEERVRGVCLIPGAGEFAYASSPVFRDIGPGRQTAENVHAEIGRANLIVSLDQLASDFPNLSSVLLVVAWFGTDLRCGECKIRPGVEIAGKTTSPIAWRAGGVTRDGARVVSLHDGAPAYGGTPSDDSVIQAIAELKARGYKVGLYPFILMDVAAGNALPDPYGDIEQRAYPWRGRITVHPAPGRPGSPDKTAAAAAQIDAFFGAAVPSLFGTSGGAPSYAGPAEWSFRRFILHYAKLAAIAGGVDTFILGSELRGVTTARSASATFPAVAALRQLASDVRSLVGPSTKLTYAADWTEYNGHQPADGSGDAIFHLDPLWADPNIDVIGVDWYPPLADWRDGEAHLDAEITRDGRDRFYLKARIEGGEAYEWYYASDEDRRLQRRTPITDGAHGEPWIYRAKDLRNFWSRQHRDRVGGVRSPAPTAWTPQSKPIWLVELGCPAVDKGANAPNLFVDAKSAEGALPPFSDGGRDDLVQRRTLEAYLDWLDETATPMIENAFLWCWDARPHPAFPARADVWADAPSWRLGHWLNGRAGLSNLGEVVAELCRKAGVDTVDVSGLSGAVSGYVADAPASARDLIEPLMAAYAFDAAERDGVLAFFHRGGDAAAALTKEALSAASSSERRQARADPAEAPIEARVRFLDPGRDYQIATATTRRLDDARGGVLSVDAPLALEPDTAAELAQRLLDDIRARTEFGTVELSTQFLSLEPGDIVTLDDRDDAFEIAAIEDAEVRRLDLRRTRADKAAALFLAELAQAPPILAPAPVLDILDLPPLPSAEDDERPLAAVFASPWTGPHAVYAGADSAPRGTADRAAVMGELVWDLWAGPADRWDEGNVTRIKLYDGAIESVSRTDVLNGANVFAIEADGEWEILQAARCVLVAPGEYEIRDLLRGQLGSEHAMRNPHPAGARIVLLDDRLARIEVASHEWGESLTFIAPPAGAPANDGRASTLTVALPRASARAWAPAHVKARRLAGGDISVTWVRRARLGGDAWGAGEPPGETPEAYQVEFLSDDAVKRTVAVPSASYIYTAASQTADFGGLPSSFRLRVAQLDRFGRPGLKRELTITL